MSETAEELSKFAGGQRIIAKHPGINELCDLMDDMKCADLGSILLLAASTRALKTTPGEVISGNHFNVPSEVPQRTFHYVEGLIYDSFPDINFIELAPTQPIGTSSILAGTDQKTIMPALRRSEVNSDATTSLFRTVYDEYMQNVHTQPFTLATNTRVTRIQAFDPKTKFLPHFRMFAQVTVGEEKIQNGPTELETLATHLATTVKILNTVAASNRGNISQLDISIGNILFLEEIIGKGLISRDEVRRHTQDPDYDYIEATGLDIPSSMSFDNLDLRQDLENLGFHKGLSVLEGFQHTLENLHPDLLSQVRLDLGRIAGIGYYKHLCFKVHAKNSEGVSLPLVDGGTTNWIRLVEPKNKNHFTVTSGIGTELLAKYFITQV